MRKILFVITTLAVVALGISCKKTEGVNPLADSDNLGKGAYITLNTAGNLNLDYANIATTEVSITVDQYPNGNDVDQIKIYVTEGSSSDPTTWGFIKTVAYTGVGTELKVNGTEIATALGILPADLSPGKFYTLYNQIITKSGETYDLSNTYSLVESNSNYNMAFRWTAFVVCPFVGPVGGNYQVVRDDWADWTPGDIVTVTDGPGPNQLDLSAVWPNPAFGDIVDPLIVDVEPSSGVATVHQVTFGDYGNLAAVHGASAGDVAGYVFSCTGYITLTMQLSYGGGNQGNLTLILQKL